MTRRQSPAKTPIHNTSPASLTRPAADSRANRPYATGSSADHALAYADLYGRSEIHRHLGFYYLVADVRPAEAVRQLEHSLALRERLGDPRRMPSALVALAEAEMAAGNPARAVDLLRRALTQAREADLLPWRIQDAEQNLHQAEAAAS